MTINGYNRSIFLAGDAFSIVIPFRMKEIRRILSCLIFALTTLFFLSPLLGIDGVSAFTIPGKDVLTPVSADAVSGSTALDKFQNLGIAALHTVKIIASGLAIIYLVYAGASMVISSSDEGSLAKSKKQIMYSLVAFLFINIPGSIYNIFANKGNSDVTVRISWSDYKGVQTTDSNLFINFTNWGSTVETNILGFIKVALVGLSIFMFVLAGIQVIGSAGDKDKLQSAKKKITNGALALVFMGIIQGWIQVAYSGDIPKGQWIFAQLANMALFFAGPVAIFFLIVGAYYFITAAGDEDRAKKGKSIVVNTFIAVIILLASYTFLKDLSGFIL